MQHICVVHGEFLICASISLTAECSLLSVNWTPGKVNVLEWQIFINDNTKKTRCPRMFSFIYCSGCDLDTWKYVKIQWKGQSQINAEDKEQGGGTARSLHGSSSSEKLDVEQQDLWRFFWSLLGNFQCFLTGSDHHSWNNPCASKILPDFSFALWERGSESTRWTLQLLHAGAQSGLGELWIVCREDGACLCPSTAAKSSACLTESTGLANWELLGSLNTKEGKQK